MSLSLLLDGGADCFGESGSECTVGILKKFNSRDVALPPKKTVTMMMTQVVVNRTCLTSEEVLLMEMLKAMAPRMPVNHMMCW